MKNGWILVFAGCLLAAYNTKGQNGDSLSNKAWQIEINPLIYFVPEDVYLLPIVKADKGRLHLESRYNYEDFNTFSLFGGYHFSGGKKLSYTITPMLGFAIGQVDGIAPGLELELNLGRFSYYTEAEYLFELNDKDNSFFYNWSELSFAPADWVWFGTSWQRLKAYKSDKEIDPGVMLGFGRKNWELTGYYFNPFGEYDFGVISLSVTF